MKGIIQTKKLKLKQYYNNILMSMDFWGTCLPIWFCVNRVIKQGDPANAILEFAREAGVDWLFLGSRGLGGVKSLLMGSVSNKVCHLAEATCITVK